MSLLKRNYVNVFNWHYSHYEKLGSVERCIDEEVPFEIPNNWVWCTCRSEKSLSSHSAGMFLSVHNLRLCISPSVCRPPRGSPAAALIACDGLVTARTVTGRKYHYPAAAVVAFGTAASVPSESWRLLSERPLMWLMWFSCYTHRREREGYVVILFSRCSFINSPDRRKRIDWAV